MSESNIPKAVADARNAAQSATQAAGKLKKVEGLGHKLTKGFEFAEHVHFAYEIGGWLVAPATALKVLGWIARAAGLFAGATVSFWNLLVLTAPLTVAAAVITACFRRNWFSDAPIIRFPFSGIVLVVAAYLSNWSGIGKAFDYADVVLRSQWLGSNPTLNMIMEWFRLPYFALVEYYRVYGFWPFALSVVAGVFMGSLAKTRPAQAR